VYEATKVPPLSYYDVQGESNSKKDKLGKKDRLESSMGLKVTRNCTLWNIILAPRK
jgi:hypothetical protein